jgi:hypothetical protein
VHDSIVVECDVEDAAEIRDPVVERIQDALALFCPTVPCVADGEVQLGLDDKTTLSEEQLAELVAASQDPRGLSPWGRAPAGRLRGQVDGQPMPREPRPSRRSDQVDVLLDQI